MPFVQLKASLEPEDANVQSRKTGLRISSQFCSRAPSGRKTQHEKACESDPGKTVETESRPVTVRGWEGPVRMGST